MNTCKLAELDSLLSEALQSVTIRSGPSHQLSFEQYRQLLERCRSVFDPQRSGWVSAFRPEITQIEAKERVLEFVNRELENYVRDGRILSATIAFAGGLSSGSPVEDVLRNLLRRALVDGPSRAAQAFLDCTTNSSCNFYQFFLLTGVLTRARASFRNASAQLLRINLAFLGVIRNSDCHRLSCGSRA